MDAGTVQNDLFSVQAAQIFGTCNKGAWSF